MGRRRIEAPLFAELAPRVSGRGHSATPLEAGRSSLGALLSPAEARASCRRAPCSPHARAGLHAWTRHQRQSRPHCAPVAVLPSDRRVFRARLRGRRCAPQAASRAAPRGAAPPAASSVGLRIRGRRARRHRNGAARARARCGRARPVPHARAPAGGKAARRAGIHRRNCRACLLLSNLLGSSRTISGAFRVAGSPRCGSSAAAAYRRPSPSEFLPNARKWGTSICRRCSRGTFRSA